ncbi:MAG: cytochrome D1 domain-containing protein [Burkholderiales bacterium]
MSTTIHARYVSAAAAVAFASVFSAAVAAGAPLPEGAQPGSVPDRYAREGVVIEFSAAPAQGAASRELMEGEFADLRFKLTDEASGQPLRGNNPGAWLDIGSVIQGQPRAEVKSCKDKVALYMRGIVGLRPMLDLNSYYVLALNRDASISVIDPLVSLARATSTLARIQIARPGADWVKSADGKRIYISMPFAGQVAVVDADRFTVLANVAAGRSPTRVFLQPDGRYLWVGNDAKAADASGVTVIDTETLKPVKSFLTGSGHHEIAVSEDNRIAFVTNRDAGTVSLIDVRELKALRDIKTGGVPISVGYSALARGAYVADGKGGGVSVLAAPDFELVKRIALKPGLGPLRFTLDGRYAFVVNTSEDLVHVIDASGNERVHDIPVSGQPFQLAFTRAYAYVRALASERVTMINLLSLGRGNKPVVQSFAAGSAPPKAGGELPLADSLAPALGDAAVLVVNPGDNTVYFYMEGMNAPSSNYQSFGASARAVTVIDRSLKETEPGVYTSKVRIPVAGRYDVAFLLESPQLVNCFSLEAKENPLLASHRSRVVVEFLMKSREVPLGATVPVRFKVKTGDGQPKTGLKDVRVLSFLVPGQRRNEAIAREVEPGLYEASVRIEELGAYSIHVASKQIDKDFKDLASFTLRTARPDIEDEVRRRLAAEKQQRQKN